jgi:hypothetical protein
VQASEVAHAAFNGRLCSYCITRAQTTLTICSCCRRGSCFRRSLYQVRNRHQDQLKFKFGSVDNQGIAEIKGKYVTLDSGRFSAQAAPLAFVTNVRQSTVQRHPSTTFTLKMLTITDSTFGAFVLLHELGHRSKIYGQYDKDGGSQYNNLPTGVSRCQALAEQPCT